MKIIHKVVVGSRLHGLAKENSDYDYRGIFMHPLHDILNPFKKVKNTSWIEDDIDDTSYELADFCKTATHGNPTILETLWSNMVEESSDIGKELVENREKFLNSKKIFDAHRGYAHNQYKKMNLFNPDERTPKFAVAYIRSLLQGISLLETGDFNPQITDDWKGFLMETKYNWSPAMIGVLGKRFAQLEVDIADAYFKNSTKFEPDYEWIADFVYRSYMEAEE
jgi:uncharacterized protein